MIRVMEVQLYLKTLDLSQYKSVYFLVLFLLRYKHFVKGFEELASYSHAKHTIHTRESTVSLNTNQIKKKCHQAVFILFDIL